MTEYVTDIEQLEYKGTPIVVCFTNPYTCNPCRVFKPHFENAAKTITEAEFVEVDATDPESAPIVQEYLTKFLTPTVILITEDGRTEIESRTTLPLIAEINDLI